MKRRPSATAPPFGLLPVLTLAGLLGGARPAQPATYHVSPAGSDSGACTAASPCRQIRRALELVGPGDTVLVANGDYLGFDVRDLDGAPGRPITIRAQGTGARVLPTTDRSDNRDTILVSYSSHVVIDGLRSFGANRAAVRISLSPHVTVRNGVFGDNAKWGIFTDFSDDLLLEGNECYGSGLEHGIYVSNSGDRPVVRGNHVHGNRGSGIQLNADVSMGGDGLITGALIEANVVHGNGASGGAALNLDGVQDSTVRNNLLYDNHATGIALFRGAGAEGPRGMEVVNNTVHQAADGRYAALVWRAAGPNRLRNNILYHPGARGSLNYLGPADVASTDSDYNVIVRVTPNDGAQLTLAEWQAQGHELHSIGATAASLFVDAAAADFRLKAGSPAIDRGTSVPSCPKDIEGNARPAGATWDLGAYEAGADAPGPPSVTITDVSLAEGDTRTTPFRFQVTLSKPAPARVTVRFRTVMGTAVAARDFEARSGVLTIGKGRTGATITVQVVGDAARESDETFEVVLVRPRRATLARSRGVGTILNDD